MHKKIIVAFLLLALLDLLGAALLFFLRKQPTSGDAVTVNVNALLPTSCATDADCAPAGCSRQLCVTKSEAPGIVTTCEFNEAYACVQLTTCGCVNNTCAWTENAKYRRCLQDAAITGRAQ